MNIDGQKLWLKDPKALMSYDFSVSPDSSFERNFNSISKIFLIIFVLLMLKLDLLHAILIFLVIIFLMYIYSKNSKMIQSEDKVPDSSNNKENYNNTESNDETDISYYLPLEDKIAKYNEDKNIIYIPKYPPDTNEFGKVLYGDMPSCKENNFVCKNFDDMRH